MFMLFRQIADQLLTPNTVHKSLCDGLQNAELPVHMLNLDTACTQALTCSMWTCSRQHHRNKLGPGVTYGRCQDAAIICMQDGLMPHNMTHVSEFIGLTPHLLVPASEPTLRAVAGLARWTSRSRIEDLACFADVW